jgi:hypothetical protein
MREHEFDAAKSYLVSLNSQAPGATRFCRVEGRDVPFEEITGEKCAGCPHLWVSGGECDPI